MAFLDWLNQATGFPNVSMKEGQSRSQFIDQVYGKSIKPGQSYGDYTILEKDAALPSGYSNVGTFTQSTLRKGELTAEQRYRLMTFQKPYGTPNYVRTDTPYTIARKTPAATPAPTPAPTPTPTPTPAGPTDAERIAAAKDAAAPFITAYSNAKQPSYSGSDPYEAANQFGLDANAMFKALIDRNEAVAKQQGTEMNVATNRQLQNFSGAVPKLENWRSYYDPLKSDIMSA